jgi:Tol biopolymer transport system component
MVNAVGRLTFWIGLTVAATLVVAGFGESKAKPFSGKIAFVASSGDVTDLFVIHADGTRLRQLTRDARGEASPTWSPDGKSLAFIATTWQPTTGQFIAKSAITVIAANGSKRRVLFRAQSRQLPLYDLAWSPKGQRIAFTWLRDPGFELWLLRLDGSADPFPSTSVGTSSWAPDGKRLAYDGRDGIFIANVRTRSARLVKGTEKSACPKWSPNGRWIAVCTRNGAGATRFQSLDVMTPTGASRRQLVKGGVISPVAWAPNSEAILFDHIKDDQASGPRQLFIVSLRDARVTPVPGTVGVVGSASWHR